MGDFDGMRRGREWAERLAGHRFAMPALGLASFLETLVVPIPIELLLVPWMLMEPHRLWRLAGVALTGCLAAALAGYGVGALLFDGLGRAALEAYGQLDAYQRFSDYFAIYGFWAILAVGVLPIPFQAAILAAGAAGYPLPVFLVAALLARGGRYFGLAGLVWLAGRWALPLWRRHRLWVTVAATLLIIAAAALSRRVVDSLPGPSAG